MSKSVPGGTVLGGTTDYAQLFALVKWVVELEPSATNIRWNYRTLLEHITNAYKHFACGGKQEAAGQREFVKSSESHSVKQAIFVSHHALGLIA